MVNKIKKEETSVSILFDKFSVFYFGWILIFFKQRELEKLHKRKIEREREREERDRERESVQRQKETEYHKEWEKQEDSVNNLILSFVFF